jgi:hypothetical protein
MRSVALREVLGDRSVVLTVGEVVRVLNDELVREGVIEGVEVRTVGALVPLKTLERETELGRLVTLGVETRGVVTRGVEGGL